MPNKLDKIDRSILRELQNDASAGIEVLAGKVHLSRNACWRRVKRLEEQGVIRGRVALVDPDALGLGLSAIVLIRTNEHDKVWLGKFRDAVRTMPQILGAHRMTGDLDYVLRVRVEDMKSYDAFYQDLIARVDIADVSASFVMEDIKDTTALAV